MSRPPARSRLITVTVVAALLVAGTVAILATGASLGHFGTLLVGCTTVGTLLLIALDRTDVRTTKPDA